MCDCWTGGMWLACRARVPLRFSIPFLLREHAVSIRSLSIALGLAAFPVVASAQVLDLGGGGSFSQPIVATNSGRAVSQFYDNTSADRSGANTDCSVGFFALGTMHTGCANQSAGTGANQGGFVGGSAFSNGTQPVPFMFSGGQAYNLRLVGSLAARSSGFGIFTVVGGVYSFTAIPSFGSKQVNSTFHVAAGSDWGFYIGSTFNSQPDGCGLHRDCSDATGGYTGAPFQQFVLMRAAGPGGFKYLVGAEDNVLETLPNASFRDSDYNDYMVEVTTVTPEPLSMALMATGLVGLAGAGFIQRRRRRNTTD